MTVVYEWDVETVSAVETEALEEGECIDHRHCATYAEALAEAAGPPDAGCRFIVVLVRDDDDGRSWAYVEDGVLPECFTDAECRRVCAVPKRFITEVSAS